MHWERCPIKKQDETRSENQRVVPQKKEKEKTTTNEIQN